MLEAIEESLFGIRAFPADCGGKSRRQLCAGFGKEYIIVCGLKRSSKSTATRPFTLIRMKDGTFRWMAPALRPGQNPGRDKDGSDVTDPIQHSAHDLYCGPRRLYVRTYGPQT